MISLGERRVSNAVKALGVLYEKLEAAEERGYEDIARLQRYLIKCQLNVLDNARILFAKEGGA